MEPVCVERIASLSKRFGTALGLQLGDDQLAPVAKAAAAGRVAVLLLEADKNIPVNAEKPPVVEPANITEE